MKSIRIDELVESWLQAGVEPSLVGIAAVIGECVVDAGVRTDEEMVLIEDDRIDGTPFGAPYLSGLDDAGRSISMAAISRLLLSRGEFTEVGDSEVRLLGPFALVGSFLHSFDRQVTIEARRADASRHLVCRRAGDVCLAEEVLEAGLHHLVFLNRRQEAELVAQVVAGDAMWQSDSDLNVTLPATDASFEEMVLGVQAVASTASLVARISRAGVEAGISQGPEMIATLYSSEQGVQILQGTESIAELRSLHEADLLSALEALLD